MVEVLTIVAIALLVAGVVGSVVPLVPGAALSLSGVYLHWWAGGYAEPGTVALVGFTVVGLVAVAVDYFAGAISARAGGASNATTALAAVAGLALFLVAGPIGIVLGVAATVFLAEFYRHRDAEAGARSAAYATVGMLASTAVQVLLTLSMLAAFLLVLVL